MISVDDLNDAQIILLAVSFAADGDLLSLRLLAAEKKNLLTVGLLYRLLLTYYPADAETQDALAVFLVHLQLDFEDTSTLDASIDTSTVNRVSEEEAYARLHELRLAGIEASEDADELTVFLVRWIHELDSAAGLSASTAQLVDCCLKGRDYLHHWRDTYLRPLLVLQNELYPNRAGILSLQTLEHLHGEQGVKTLLQFSDQDGEDAQVGRDIDLVVAPWVRGTCHHKRRRIENAQSEVEMTSWQDINNWIFDKSKESLKVATVALEGWNGPRQPSQDHDSSETETDAHIRYAQTGLAVVLRSDVSDLNGSQLLERLLSRVAGLVESSVSGPRSDPEVLGQATKADLLENNLTRLDNKLTLPTEENLMLFHTSLQTQRILQKFRIEATIMSVVDTTMFASEDRQKSDLQRIILQVPRMTASGIDWLTARDHINYLRAPGTSPTLPGFLGRIQKEHIEHELLDAILVAGQHQTAKEIYLSATEPPLPKKTVHDHVVAAIFKAYDNATNGNRTRGRMKRAYELLMAFQPLFKDSTELSCIEHLIKATHSMSFYTLTLQHGVPFQPAMIRAHSDPLSLVSKVLEQNGKAYTNLDDLVSIARGLVLGGLSNSSDPHYAEKEVTERLFDAEHRVTYEAIASALAYHDFDTAYSYIMSRLSTSPSQTSTSPYPDDTSWRAAYAAGKYRSPSSPKSVHDRINLLSKQMDLLSMALTLAPTPDPLSEVLATWRRSEEEMESLRTEALEEERALDSKGSASDPLSGPGGFGPDERERDAAETRRMIMERRTLGGGGGGGAMSGSGPSYEEEAPMGLFDVARGAANAFRKTAFPLRAGVGSRPGLEIGSKGQVMAARGRGRGHMKMVSESGSDQNEDKNSDGSHEQRVRKRDMVSNMVTGGLVSGLSWALGAAPVNRGGGGSGEDYTEDSSG